MSNETNPLEAYRARGFTVNEGPGSLGRFFIRASDPARANWYYIEHDDIRQARTALADYLAAIFKPVP